MKEQHLPLYSQKHLAFISLALGFLVIWTAVLAGVLVSRTVKDETTAKETTKVFHTHEDVGKIAFALGHELVSTVDWLLSKDTGKPEKNSIYVTWKMTDSVLHSVKQESKARWVSTVVNLLDMLESKLGKYRTSLDVDSNPLDVMKFYLELSDMMLGKCFLLDYAGQHLPVPSLSYTLFIRGMSRRFGELVLGTIYVKSELPLNKSEYLTLRASSQELMDAAFHFTPRAQTKWWELQEQEPTVRKVLSTVAEDILSGGQLRGKNKLAAAYLDSVTEEIGMLLLTKEVLNSTLSTWVDRLSQRSHNTLAFHMSIAIVAVVAVILCLIIIGCSFRHIDKGQNEEENFKQSTESVYNASDKTHILSSPNYL